MPGAAGRKAAAERRGRKGRPALLLRRFGGALALSSADYVYTRSASYDPVIAGGKCVTTFMAVEPGPEPKVYPNFIEFHAVPAAGGTLCTNGKWRAFEGGASGTTPFRIFFKDGTFRAAP